EALVQRLAFLLFTLGRSELVGAAPVLGRVDDLVAVVVPHFVGVEAFAGAEGVAGTVFDAHVEEIPGRPGAKPAAVSLLPDEAMPTERHIEGVSHGRERTLPAHREAGGRREDTALTNRRGRSERRGPAAAGRCREEARPVLGPAAAASREGRVRRRPGRRPGAAGRRGRVLPTVGRRRWVDRSASATNRGRVVRRSAR